MSTKFGSKNADLAYDVLSDLKVHTSYEFNERVGWDWRKAVSLVKKYGERTGEFVVLSEPWQSPAGPTVKKYWLVNNSFHKNLGVSHHQEAGVLPSKGVAFGMPDDEI